MGDGLLSKQIFQQLNSELPIFVKIELINSELPLKTNLVIHHGCGLEYIDQHFHLIHQASQTRQSSVTSPRSKPRSPGLNHTMVDLQFKVIILKRSLNKAKSSSRSSESQLMLLTI